MVPEPAVVEPVPRGESRVPTGCPELDEMLRGGLVGRRPYLLVGPSGTGKTSLGLQFLCEGVRRGERCLIVTLEEPPNEMRANHRALAPEIDQVYVFDAIPDVMRYERAPFKDIAAVRAAVPFKEVPFEIRQTPELASVEVTFTALEQMLKTEVARRGYTRVVIDSLTALEYFCMKGFDETLGAQTFLRFLSDLRVTTLLTVEAPLEDVDSPERLLARGEIRLFRWEHEGRTVRAIGVEKFRGSEHDVRLHPYRISSRGLAINLAVTISRDTREILTEPAPPRADRVPASDVAVEDFATLLTSIEEDTHDLLALGIDALPVRRAIAEAVAAAEAGQTLEASARVGHARAVVIDALQRYRDRSGAPLESDAARRLAARAAEARAGRSPPPFPDADMARPALVGFLHRLDEVIAARAPPAVVTTGGSDASPPTLPVDARVDRPLAEMAPAPPRTAPPVTLPSPPSAAAVSPTPLPPPLAPPSEPPATGASEVKVPAFDLPPAESPPPLPQVLSAGSEPPVAPATVRPEPLAALGTAATAGALSGPTGPPPLPEMNPPTVPESAPSAAPTEPVSPPKRKRKTPGGSAPRKRAGPRTALAADSGDASGALGVPAAKPKRKPPARRKAPPVTAAEAGAPPPEEHRVPTPPPAADPSAPATEDPPTAADPAAVPAAPEDHDAPGPPVTPPAPTDSPPPSIPPTEG